MNPQGNVLVIDDDEAVRLRIGDLLQQIGGLAFHEAPEGFTGVELAQRIQPDLILLDNMMPGMTGIEVCTALRAQPATREIPIIMLSAADESEAMIAALEAGADDFLRKPFFAPELRAKVRTIMRLNRFRSLAGERDRLRWLLDHSLEPLIVADAKGGLVYANQSARQTFELADEPGTDVANAISRHFRAEPAEAWAAWRELRWPRSESFAVFQPESKQVGARWFEVELHALDAEASQTLIKFTNRSGLVRHELETFTFQHLISHKIRTPLNGLAPIFAFLAASEKTADEDTAGLLHFAQESAERLESTLTGILSYHAAMFGAPRERGPNIPRQPLDAIVATAATSAGLSGRVTLSAPEAVTGASACLEVILTELIENYAKFSDAPKAGVRAELTRRSNAWELRLFAPGPGLPPDVVARLGRPYAQLEKRFTGEIPGVGLGLATVRLLLRSMGGDVAFANHARPSGLITTVQLPLPTLQPISAPHAGNTHSL